MDCLGFFFGYFFGTGRQGLGASASGKKLKAPHKAGLRKQYNKTQAGAGTQARESRDKPILNAFCRVALSVRLSVLAMLAARFFLFARVFNVRICSCVHARRFDFLAI